MWLGASGRRKGAVPLFHRRVSRKGVRPLFRPTSGNRWFAATVNAAFPFGTSFLGDYSNIAILPGSGGVVSYWTDLRNDVSFAGRTGHGEDAYFAKTP